MRTLRVSCLLLAFTVPFVSACSDDETTTPPEETCRDYADVTAGGSLETDVMPLLERSCSLATSCHQGSPGDGQEGLGLGPNMNDGPADAMLRSEILTQLTDTTPMRSSLPYVVPGDPAGSWLMNKIEYDKDDLPMCTTCDDCGDFMPLGSPSTSGFTREERDLIAAWIKDGAQDN